MTTAEQNEIDCAKIKLLQDAIKEMRDFYEVMHSKDCRCKYCVVVRLAGLTVWTPDIAADLAGDPATEPEVRLGAVIEDFREALEELADWNNRQRCMCSYVARAALAKHPVTP